MTTCTLGTLSHRSKRNERAVLGPGRYRKPIEEFRPAQLISNPARMSLRRLQAKSMKWRNLRGSSMGKTGSNEKSC